MDIDKELDKIIFKYDLDRYYPRYRMMRKAEELIKSLAESWTLGEHVVLISAEADKRWKITRGHILKLVESVQCKAMVDVLSCYCCPNETEYEKFYDTRELEKLKTSSYNRIIIVSWEGEEFVCDWMLRNIRDTEIFTLYDYLAWNGLYFEDEYYNFIHDQKRPWPNFSDMKFYKKNTNLILFEFNRQEYKRQNSSEELRKILLKKNFFLALIVRNFVCINHLYKEISDYESDDCSVYIKVWDEIQIFLDRIRKKLSKRTMDDILMFWLDAVSYDDAKQMPNLQKQMGMGICFENMRGIGYHTSTSLRSLFCKKSIEENSYDIKNINEDNSEIIYSMMDYKKCRISGIFEEFGDKFAIDKYHYSQESVSSCLWETLRQILLNPNKSCFVITHVFQEAHALYISSKMKRNVMAEYRSEGLMEIDEQLGYYCSYFPKSATKIYMSDHGNPGVPFQNHTIFGILDTYYRPANISSLCSHIDFSKIFHALLEKHNISDSLFERESVESIELPLYNANELIRIFRFQKHMGFGFPILFYGYRSITTLDHIYVHYDYGRELLYRRDQPLPLLTWYERDEDVCDPSLLPKFRKMLHKKDVAPKDDPKFRYAHYLPEVIRRAMPRNLEKIACINRMVSGFPDGSVALRMGGEYGCQLYYALRQANRRKLACVIDNNPNCQCASLGIPVVSQKEADMAGLAAVVLCSSWHIDELREEAKDFPDHVKVLVVEECLAKEHLDFKHEFWFFEPSPEDWDVGFPLQ